MCFFVKFVLVFIAFLFIKAIVKKLSLSQPNGANKLSLSQPNGAKRYDNFSLLRAVPETPSQLESLTSLRNESSLDFWTDATELWKGVDVLVGPGKRDEWSRWVVHHNLSASVLRDNIQELLDKEAMSTQQLDENARGKRSADFLPHRLTQYPTLNKIYSLLGHIGASCGYCEVEVIGRSHENRKIHVVKILKTSGIYKRQKRVVLIDAGFHSREWIAPVTAINFILKLLQGEDAMVEKLLEQFSFYVVPMVNPDGYLYSWEKDRLWRKNRSKPKSGQSCYGTDLNRNWDFHWEGEGSSNDSCKDNYRGEKAFSEPETAALSNFVMTHRKDLAAYLNLHSYGQLILAPWGFSKRTPADFLYLKSKGMDMVDAIRKTTGHKYQFGSSANILYVSSGSSDDWMKAVAQVKISFTIELRDAGHHGFNLPADQIEGTSHELNAAVFSLCSGLAGDSERFKLSGEAIKRDNITANRKEFEKYWKQQIKKLNLKNYDLEEMKKEAFKKRIEKLIKFKKSLDQKVSMQYKAGADMMQHLTALKEETREFKEREEKVEMLGEGGWTDGYVLHKLIDRLKRVKEMFAKAVSLGKEVAFG